MKRNLVKFELVGGWQYLNVGAYWEVWPEPYRLDIWIGIPFLALHIIVTKEP